LATQAPGSGEPKSTSWSYGEECQRDQADKYRNRDRNHWRTRIDLAHRLVDEYALPALRGRPPEGIVVLDVGCSIGTFAIEFAKRGFRTLGVDFDASALAIAEQLAAEEGVKPEFLCHDLADLPALESRCDIAVCFDVFEHLHDDELGSLLHAVRRSLSPEGCLVFHTFPTQYDHLFFGRRRLDLPLRPFRRLRPAAFERLVTAYAAALDCWSALRGRQTHRESIARAAHCNPLTPQRLRDILERLGFAIETLETAQLYPYGEARQRWFEGQPVAHRNLFGVARPV
jgi:2-polyprenyl-3-methyl-5-hydroxy-6-metoxy-1,4-benzoquinol methylase